MTIGQPATRPGLSVRRLRFYADAGVLPEAGRTEAGYRLFGPEAVARARLVLALRELGVGLDDVTRVLTAEASLSDVAAAHARALDAQIRTLRLQRAVLACSSMTCGRTAAVPTPADVAATVREHGIDLVCIDTIPAWLQDRYDISRGIPEQANDELETIRRLADRDIAFVGVVHTRKLDRAAGSITDELEELAGTLAKKADSAVVIRRDGDGPRRKISFPKTRRGPEPVAVIASSPDPDCDETPRLRVIAEAKPRLKEGTEAERIAEWIGEQQAPATVSVITAALEISEDTLRRRRPELEGLGIRYGQVPGSTARAYGTPEQWRDVHGLIPEDAA